MLACPTSAGTKSPQRLREFSAARVLIITAFPDPSDEPDLSVLDVDAYLTKPFRPAQLAELAQQLCLKLARHNHRWPMPRKVIDPEGIRALVFNLAYIGTVTIAALMLLGKLFAFTALAALAASPSTCSPIPVNARRFRTPGSPLSRTKAWCATARRA